MLCFKLFIYLNSQKIKIAISKYTLRVRLTLKSKNNKIKPVP